MFLVFGGVGYFLSNQEKLNIRESSVQFISLGSDKQSFKDAVKFSLFPKNFYNDLKAVVNGNLKLAINHRIIPIGSQDNYILFNKKKLLPGTLYVLDFQEVVSLINDKKIEFTIHRKILF